MESFIEHQDACNCNMGNVQGACLSRTASSPSPSCSDTNFSSAPNWAAPSPLNRPVDPMIATLLTPPDDSNTQNQNHNNHNLDLKLSTTSSNVGVEVVSSKRSSEGSSSKLIQLSMGWGDRRKKKKMDERVGGAVRVAMAEKAYAEEAREEAKREIEMAEEEFANAKRMRQEAQAELDKASCIKEAAIKRINSTMLEITCQACQKQFQANSTTTSKPKPSSAHHDHSLAFSYVSSVITTEGEVHNKHINQPPSNN